MNTAQTAVTPVRAPRKVAVGLSDDKIARTKVGSVTQWTQGKGLYLKANWTPGAFHSWRFDFKNPTKVRTRPDGEKVFARDTMTIGPYPAVSIEDAKKAAEAARAVLAQNKCPKEARAAAEKERAERLHLIAAGKVAPDTVRALAEEVRATFWRAPGTAPEGFVQNWCDDYAARWMKILNLHAFPAIGDKLAADVTPAEVYALLKKLTDSGKKPTSRKVRFSLDVIFSLAQAKGLRIDNPVQPIAKVMRGPKGGKQHKAVKTVGELVELYKAIRSHEDRQKCNLLLIYLYTGQRSHNVREMKWADLDLENAMWRISPAEMKRVMHLKREGDAHMVPLSSQAVEALREQYASAKKGPDGLPVSKFVFYVAWRDRNGVKPVGEKYAREELYRMGFRGRQDLHGFRALLRTTASQNLGIDSKVLECQIAHGNGEPLGAAYARETWLEQRKEAVQVWADYIDRLTASGTVIELQQRAA